MRQIQVADSSVGIQLESVELIELNIVHGM